MDNTSYFVELKGFCGILVISTNLERTVLTRVATLGSTPQWTLNKMRNRVISCITHGNTEYTIFGPLGSLGKATPSSTPRWTLNKTRNRAFSRHHILIVKALVLST